MADEINGTEPIKGPASYFPVIEKTYGKPMPHWFKLVASRKGAKHADIVNWLKKDHGLTHGHANAIAAHVRASSAA